jgi:NADH-quinone oxidoreductase subunit L
MVRLWKIVFLGPARSDAAAHAHEGGATLWAPLVLLAALAVVGGYKGLYPNAFAGVIALIPEAEGPAHGVVLVTSLIVLLVGAGTAFALYGPVPAGAAAGGSADAPGVAEDALERASPGLFGLLVANQRSFDRVYDYYVAKVQQRFAMVLNFIDLVGLSGVVIRGGAGLAELLGFGARAAHTGRINTYVYWFLAGVAVLWAMAAGLF